MSLTATATTLAVSPNITSSFLGVGGVSPYTYSVRPGGAGGTIVSTGVYTAPAALNSNPALTTDVVVIADSVGSKAYLTIKICSPPQLVVDVIQTVMGLEPDQVYLWDQKINIPTDSRLYVALGIASCKPFGNSNFADGNGNTVQSLNVMAMLDLFVFSRSSLARDMKEQVVMTFNSQYAESQMEANSFYISPLTTQFVNISEIDGAAIPYKFHLNMAIQYFVTKTLAEPYYSTFLTPQIVTND